MMMHQLKAIVGVLAKPRTTFRELPSNSIYALAFLTPLYFGYSRALRTGSLKRMTELVGSSLLAHLVLLLIALVAIPFGALLVKVVVRLFGKRLTLVKLMNIYGYAFVPRLAVSIPASICFAMLPEDTKAMMLLGEVPGWFIALTALGGIVFLYSIFLWFYGVVVSPSYGTDQAEEGEQPAAADLADSAAEQ